MLLKHCLALKLHDITGNDISHLVCTHGHADHVGNNNLFLNAVHIVGHAVEQHDRFRSHDFSESPYSIGEDIDVLATPGHTAECVSVVVRNCVEGTVVIAGKLIKSNTKKYALKKTR